MNGAVWVRQEDVWGCTVAALAMLTGQTYATVKAELGFTFDQPGQGVAVHDCDQYLAEHGYAVARKYPFLYGHKRAVWPVEPFSALHLCQVIVAEASPGAHMVVMLADGAVLDPLTPLPQRLTAYHRVHNVAAVTLLPCRDGGR